MHGLVWTNGTVTLTKDLIFGVCVLATHGWQQLYELDDDELKTVTDLVSNDPSCPFLAELKRPAR